MTVLAKTLGHKHGVLIIFALSVAVFFFCINHNVGNKFNTDMISSSEKLMANNIRSNDKSSEVKGTRIATLGKSQANTMTNVRMAQHSELVQQLSTYGHSFKITRNSNFNRSYGLSKLWTEFGYTKGAEVAVWKGNFSWYVLGKMPTLTSYVLVDSWRHLDNWNKPWNKDNDEFEAVFQTAMENTKTFRDAGICSVVRGTNVEAAPQIPDASLDFVYLDGDHTLRGIMFDLYLYVPKVRPGGMVCGDDYTFGQHGDRFDPTMVKPYVDLYGELHHLSIVDLGENQFCFIVPP